MNKIIMLPLFLLVAGCGQKTPSPDAAKIDDLSRKIDILIQAQSIIYSNQYALWNAMNAVRLKVSALPDTKTIDSMAYYYHTNSMFSIEDDLEKNIRFYGTNIQSTQVDQWIKFWQAKQTEAAIQTPTPNSTQQDQIAQDVLDIDMRCGDMSDDIEQLKSDTQKIKTRLGIIY